MSTRIRLGAAAGMLALATLGVAAAPGSAKAWWVGGWRGGIGIGVVVPPVVIAPPVYAPPPVYYGPPPVYYAPPTAVYAPRRVWVPPHWRGPYWVPGHWS